MLSTNAASFGVRARTGLASYAEVVIPLSDENPTLRAPVVTILLLVAIGCVWVFVQGAGLDEHALAASVCNFGLVPGEITHLTPVGRAVPLGPDIACVVDREPVNWLTPITSMFLHGGWMHVLGNGLFLWVFGNNVEDSMGRVRFAVFYVLCGVAAAALQVVIDPDSAVPMVGASGAIAGTLGAYLRLYPRAHVNMLFVIIVFVRVIPLPAWMVLFWWILWQVLGGLPQLSPVDAGHTSGVAFWAHIGGFAAGALLIGLFVNRAYYAAHPHGHARTGWLR